MIIKNNVTSTLLLTLSVVVITCAVYWQVFSFPFIQDDWALLELFRTNDPITQLIQIFNPSGKIFYRPLAQAYILAMHALFGANAIPFHIVAILLHIINSYLVALLIYAVVGDRLISYLSALVYAAAIAIHLDPLAWAVGIYDLGGAFFFFITMWCFISNKPILSALLYFTGCLFKESLIVLPLLLFSYPILMQPSIPFIKRLKALILSKQTILFSVAMIAILLFKLPSGASPLHFSATHPYVINLWGAHVTDNALKYITWMSQSFFFLTPVSSASNIVLIYGLLVSLVVYRFRRQDSQFRRIAFFLFWILVGLLPIIFLPNHTYRYYATYALPAFIGLSLVLIKYSLLSLNARQNLITIIMISVSLLGVFGSIFSSNKAYLEGLDQKTLSDGTNMLIRRAAFVKIVHDGLITNTPSLPSNAIIAIGNTDLWSFHKDSGPRIWYDNAAIRVYSLSDLKYENGQPYISNPIENQLQGYTGPTEKKVFVDPSNLFAFEVLGEKLIRINPQEMNKP